MKPQPTAHREGVYGWYPPSHNIYTKPSYKQLSGYDKECLFKHWYSAYSGVPGAKAPPPPGIGYVDVKDTSRAGSRVGSQASHRSRAATSQSIRSDRKASPTRIKYLTSSGSIRPGSKSVAVSPTKAAREAWQNEAVFSSQKTVEYAKPWTPMSRIPQPDLTHYGFSYGDTPLIPETPQPFLDSQASESASVPIRPLLTPPTPPQRSASPTRAKSASSTTSRQRLTASSRRSVKSAGPVRPQMTPPATYVSAIVEETAILSPPRPPTETRSDHDDAEIPKILTPPPPPKPSTPPKSQTPAESFARSASSVRPATVDPMSPQAPFASPVPTPCAKTPVPPSSSSRRDRIKSAPLLSEKSSRASRPCAPTPSKCAQISKEDSDAGLTYDELLDKYGWRMQVHGDPLNIKKKCIDERLKFTVQCSPPEELPDPPKVHIEVWDTFFSNTIPRKPLSYTIHPDFVSEVLHAKRMELQKREGLNYRYKDFAFAY